MAEPRTFYLAAQSEAEAEDWVFWLKFLAERLDVLHTKRKGSGGGDESKVCTRCRLPWRVMVNPACMGMMVSTMSSSNTHCCFSGCR